MSSNRHARVRIAEHHQHGVGPGSPVEGILLLHIPQCPGCLFQLLDSAPPQGLYQESQAGMILMFPAESVDFRLKCLETSPFNGWSFYAPGDPGPEYHWSPRKSDKILTSLRYCSRG